ncbi:MAG TPA: hypothetical protein VGT03_03175 [Candidatus Acidoferrales bacterium]|nr:hypothetical protein [Candidatus Acidoferrales bacterium]
MHRTTERKGTQRRVIICIFLIWAGLSYGGSARAQARNLSGAPRNSCIVPNDEVQVFIAYELYYHQATVIVTWTQEPSLDIDGLNVEFAAQGRGIPPDLRADFKKKNISACAIRPFVGAPRLRFISEAELKRSSRDGRTPVSEFYERFGKDTNLNLLSRVAFNSDKTLALLHVSDLGGGDLCLFERKNGKWVMKWHTETWAT